MNKLIDKQTNKQVNLNFLYSQKVRRTTYWFYESDMFCSFKEFEGSLFNVETLLLTHQVICVAACKINKKNRVQFTFVELDPKRWVLPTKVPNLNCNHKKKWYQIFTWDKELHRNIYV